jgi:hypothetical protein
MYKMIWSNQRMVITMEMIPNPSLQYATRGL